MEKKVNNTTDNQQLEQKTTQESELPSLKELDRRVPSLPHDESDDAWA